MLFNQGIKLGRAQKAVVIAIVVLLCVGFALMMYGEWGPSIGQAAMGARIAQTLGVALYGVSMLSLFGLFTWLDVKEVKHTAPSLRRVQWQQLVREIGTVALNLLIYGGTAVLFFGVHRLAGWRFFDRGCRRVAPHGGLCGGVCRLSPLPASAQGNLPVRGKPGSVIVPVGYGHNWCGGSPRSGGWCGRRFGTWPYQG